jgi:NAD(P)H-dependent flavin oxidoreductase YrpB (nitropropane dioxygenase family)
MTPGSAGCSMKIAGTSLLEMFDLRVPLVLAPFGPWDQVERAAAVCGAGALGSVGTPVRSVDELEAQWHRLRARTHRPFVINHTGRQFKQAAFDATLAFGPAAISFHMGVPAELIAAAHERNILWVQTVADVEAAVLAVEAGADVLIAQGTEAGGAPGGSPRWCSSRLSSMLPEAALWSPPVASPTGAGSPLRWPLARRATAWRPASWPRPR